MNANNLRLLALDFDGVIADSIQECLVVGNNALVAFSGKNHKIQQVEELAATTLEKARRMRNFIRSGEDYVYIFYALQKKIELKTQLDFDTFLMANTELRASFFDLFYLERQALLTKHRDRWLSLNPLYRGIKPLVNNYCRQNRLAIITTKKIAFVEEILHYNRIKPQPDALFHAHEDRSKKDIIEDLLLHKQLDPGDVHFVDDQVDNLVTVSAAKVCCILAAWGYNDDKQRQKASENKIKILTLADFLKYYASA
ncbi:HAD hydrolase-like protein [candidate division KSB1 bacterium]|nr:HAD hydrolase-like protein [candidate division KSB1 bacterium]